MELKQSHDLMTCSQPLPTVVKLTSKINVTNGCHSVSQHGPGIYVGFEGGVGLVTRDGEMSRVMSTRHNVHSVCLYDNEIYALVFKSDGWSVRVYNLTYQLSDSWRHDERCEGSNQLVVRDNCVLIPNRDRKTIIQYSLAGEVKRLIACLVLKDADTWFCVTPSHCDTMIVSCDDAVSCIDAGTGLYLWSTANLEKPTAVCCDDDDRVWVAVAGYSDTLQIAVLNCKTGETVSFLAGVCLCLSNTCQYQSAPDSDCQCLSAPLFTSILTANIL